MGCNWGNWPEFQIRPGIMSSREVLVPNVLPEVNPSLSYRVKRTTE